MSCVYVCIDGKRKLLSGDCPIVPCAEDGGECFLPNGSVSVSPCPEPWAASQANTDEATDGGTVR